MRLQMRKQELKRWMTEETDGGEEEEVGAH